jgi:fumarate reductase (CoM/CoB) subunit A
MTNPAFAAVFQTRDKEDSPDVFFKDMVEGGYFLSDEKKVRIVTKQASDEVLYLESLGVRFDRTENGEIEQYPMPSHSKRRACRLDDNMGRILLMALRNEMARLGVEILEDFLALDLIARNQKVVGATGFLWSEGIFLTISAKAVVMATGGHEALYSFRSTTPRATGDGIALAWRAGAEMVDLEFMQFNPYAMIYPRGAAGVLVPMNGYIMTRGGKYRNNLGEPFIDKWDPVRKEATTRDIKTKAMFTEMSEGRGSEHGGVYLDLKGLEDLDGMSPRQVLERIGEMHNKYLNQFGVDILSGEPLEVAPAAHFGLGGIWTNEKTEASLKGLYAAGEVSGGLHGANRMDATSMSEIFVFGAISGREAASYSSSSPRVSLSLGLAEKERRKAIAFLEGANGKTKVGEAKRQLEDTMFNYFGIIKDATRMKRGMRKMEKLKSKVIPDLQIKDKQMVANYDLLEAFEFKNMLEVAKAIAVSAMNRKESRGAHYRKDFPEKQENWCRNTIVKQVGGQIKISMREVVREEARS